MTELLRSNLDKVNTIFDKYNREASKLIPILQEVQDIFTYLPEDIIHYTAHKLNLSPARVFGVATFYSHFALTPKGKYVIKICDGTACHVKKSTDLIDAIRNRLDLTEKKATTDDQLFTLETVSCLGACGLAPVVVINDDVFGAMTPEKIDTELTKIIEKEADNAR